MGGMGQMTDKFSLLSGLGIRPDWVKQNPDKAAMIGAAVAAPFTGGASLAAVGPGALGGAAAAAPIVAEGAAAGGLLGGAAAATPEIIGAAGTQALAAAAPEMAVNGATGAGMLESSGAAGELGATSSGVGAAGEAANPLSVGIGNFKNSATGQTLDKGMDAFKTYNKVNAASQQMQPQGNRTVNVSKPMSMGQPVQNLSQSPFAGANPFAQGQGGLGGQSPDAAKLMLLKRMGLLGAMQ